MGDEEIIQARHELLEYAHQLFRSVSDTPLPPLCVINHDIPLIDPNCIYPWCPSKCPEALRPQWATKHNDYIANDCWRITSSLNTVPMMLIKKPALPGEPIHLCTVIDLHAWNANTSKMSLPLPNQDGMLRQFAATPYRSLRDMKDAYEQVQVNPDHVERTAVSTPDGNMVSNVIQIGDCNAPATFQALMNHIFSPYIGQFMDIYLDDIAIYSQTLDEHIEHVKIMFDVLMREKLYLSKNKLHLLKLEIKILG